MPRLVIACSDPLRMANVAAALNALALETMTISATTAQIDLLHRCLDEPFDVAVVDAALFEAMIADAAHVADQPHDTDQVAGQVTELTTELAAADMTEPAFRFMQRHALGSIVVLSDPGDVTQRLHAFAVGAEDCLEYPCHPQELCARVQVILRRHLFTPVVDVAIIVAGDLVLQPRALAARLGDRVLNLTSTEFNLLALLAREPGQVQSRDSLAQRVLGRHLSPYDRSIDTHISHLRRKLSLKAHPQLALRSVRGNGYVLLLKAA